MTDRAGSPAPSRRATTGTGAGTATGTGTAAGTGRESGSDPGSCGGPAGAGAAPRGYLSVRAGEWAFAVVGLPLALLGGVYALAVVYAGALLSLTVLGLPFVALALRGARGWGTLHRWFLDRFLGAYVQAPAGAARPGGVLARGRAMLADPVAWRTLLYLVLRLPLGVLGFAGAVLLPLGCGWLAGFPLWKRLLEPGPQPVSWLDPSCVVLGVVLLSAVPGAVRVLSRAERHLARQLLSPARAHRRVRELEAARAVLLMENTDRLRRLERDLHDGTQARLVALAITLSLADDALEPAAPDHERLRTLVGRARGQTDETITELRRLTQGLHPVALDHGLDRALPGLAAVCPVPVTMRLDLSPRPHPVVEQALYFCAAELLANIAKHSGARSAELTATATVGGRVRLTVRDDGCGGAVSGTGGATGGGTGLAGLAERLAAVDGSLRIDSPPGGPTTITAELPTHP
ncbi:sensor histidine kinase [Streptomyces sp. adm13(2018)]|uniref:sensor histidine kinase n=1 Tax=Streptomyces sp. adm13(2018) TaxID=2479007 RepID=UPI0011CE3A29|nr:sensor histidine kinase [Streptomyces sp. adm13(2018)]TXS12623.1 sensor histidine kinase [Streptomyces sp. adm13(2018)]